MNPHPPHPVAPDATPSRLGEFELIARYFARAQRPLPSHVVLGVGDDCALLQPTAGMQWAVSTDMLVSGRHFFPDTDPRGLGHKALAVNLSDLAACGARPLGFTLALSLPSAEAHWLHDFAQGLFALADAQQCPLVGGDTTQGPLTLCITVFGEIPPGQALLRSGARPGDDIWVSGTVGDAAWALDSLLGAAAPNAAMAAAALPPLAAHSLAQARLRLEQPSPRVALGMALRGLASAAADISDGLLADLGHILQASGVGAEVEAQSAINLIAAYATPMRARGQFDAQSPACAQALRYVFSGGDDYELVFTAPAHVRAQVAHAGVQCGIALTRIGQVVAQPGVVVRDPDARPLPGPWPGFDHFANTGGA